MSLTSDCQTFYNSLQHVNRELCYDGSETFMLAQLLHEFGQIVLEHCKSKQSFEKMKELTTGLLLQQ